MKIKTATLLAICFQVIFSTAIIAQQNAAVSSAQKDKHAWRPVKVHEDGKNSLNGVNFFRKPSECNSEKVVIIKAVNTNSYPVRINWNGNNGSKKSIVIQASSEVEGNCTDFMGTDTNSPKKLLVFVKQKSRDMHETKSKLLSQIEVVAEKN